MPKRTDRFSKAKRSWIMSRIRGRNTKLDLAMKKLLSKGGVKFKMYPRIDGKPDFLVGRNIALFCDSSFWHGRDWTKLKRKLESGSNPSYWVNHISQNRARDRSVNRQLRRQGYRVLRFWDTTIFREPEHCVKEIRSVLRSL